MAVNKYIDAFMDAFPFEALTFDDVSLITQYADFLPGESDLKTRLTRDIQLNIPFISAAMDTVTEAPMAIGMAMLGGIGIVHKNLDAKEQASMVGTVKHHLNGLIDHPITLLESDTLETIHDLKARRGYSFMGFPILDTEKHVVGIVTNRDIKYAERSDTPLREVMEKKVITAPAGTELQEAYDIMVKHRIGKLPLVDQDDRLAGLYSFTDVQALIKKAAPLYNRDSQYRLRVGAAVGPGDEARVEELNEEHVDVIVVDTAHGHSAGVMDMTRWVKRHYPHIQVVAGNIATAEAALALEKAGADGVKVGIGPGSICTTRVVAGVGVPQITAIYNCAQALDNRIPVIADGGIRHSGDVAKAIAAGADTVMMGSILAGTQESPGEKIISQGRQYVMYRGMGSLDAMKARAGSRERYGLKDTAEEDLVPQGIEGMVPFAGTVAKVVRQFTGGLEASLGYCGTRTIAEMRERAQFVRVSGAGVREAHPHDVKITKEAPNYRS